MKRSFRTLRFEQVEPRRLLASLLHNSALPADVNSDGAVSAVDALVIINRLDTRNVSGQSDAEEASSPYYLDVNHDQQVTAADALVVINQIAATGDIEVASTAAAFDINSIAKAPGVGSTFAATLRSTMRRASATEVKIC